MKCNILILHNIEDFFQSRRSTTDYILAFQKYAPRHNYHYHRITFPVTDALRNVDWDAVIFESTAVGICTFRPRELFHRETAKWNFLANTRALKIVFPQDDASHGRLMDEWFAELNCDALFTVRPEHVDLIYPRTSQRAKVFQALPGYIDDDSVEELQRFAKPFDARSWDIGQRVTMYPARGGRLGRLKGLAALAVKEEAQKRGIRESISVDPGDVFYGDDWYRFLGDCQFVIGSEGGLGVWDPIGEVYDRTEAYVNEHPDASFDEVEAACFPGLDGNPNFPGFSPRILEAALLSCGQILVEGHYRGFLQPYEHYIPLMRDFSNMDEVFALINDRDRVLGMIARAQHDLVENREFRYSTFVRKVTDFIDCARRGGAASDLEGMRFQTFQSETWRQLVTSLRRDLFAEGFRGDALRQRIVDTLAGQFPEMILYSEKMGTLGSQLAGISVDLEFMCSHPKGAPTPGSRFRGMSRSGASTEVSGLISRLRRLMTIFS